MTMTTTTRRATKAEPQDGELLTGLALLDFSTTGATRILITPAIAHELIDKYSKDRKTKQIVVDRLVADLRAGDYDEGNQAVGLGTDMSIVDGLARLRAVDKSGIPIWSWVITGLSPKTREVLDTGRSFKLKDALDLRGLKNTGAIAATLNAVQAWERGEHTEEPKTGISTNRSGLRFFDEHPEITTVAIEAVKLSGAVPLFTTKVAAPLIWAFDKLDREDRTDFFKMLVNGQNLPSGSFILQLRDILSSEARKPDRISARAVSALTIKAFNEYRNPTNLVRLVFKAGGSKAETFPIPR